jgi:HAD superfamily hydrolase (TIGR01549 family)
MALDASQIKAVVFDYGNTLIEFTARQVYALEEAIAGAMGAVFGPFDLQRYIELRRIAYRSPYSHPELRECTVDALLGDHVRELYGRDPRDGELDPVIAAHDEHFVKLIEAPDYLDALLERLRRRYRLAVVSNYPCGRSIRASLKRTGIEPRLDAVVVSGELGYVKPHPILFRTILERLGVEPREALFVGDNWLGDVQGAKRAGMWAAHTTQFDTLEVFAREEGHHEADLVIGHLTELEQHL